MSWAHHSVRLKLTGHCDGPSVFNGWSDGNEGPICILFLADSLMRMIERCDEVFFLLEFLH